MPKTFRVTGQISWIELEKQLRAIPLLDQPETQPYSKAIISIERFRLSELAPTTRYIQADLLETQVNIRELLLPQGYDQLDLRSGGIIVENGQESHCIIPPIVEQYEPDGATPYIIDGAHRAQLARLISQEADPQLTVIFVRGEISRPPYAYPNAWEEVEITPKRPDDKSMWKNYRDFANRYNLYRDYSSIVSSSPRGLY